MFKQTNQDLITKVSEKEYLLGGSENDSGEKFQKRLGLSNGVILVISMILGSGVFVSPALIARETSSPGMLLIMWLAGGIIALLSALCYCEIGCMFKMSGGNYANILNIYGDAPAFLCAWVTCLVIDPACVSVVALSLGTYAAKPFYDIESDAENAAKFIGFGAILLCFVINSTSVDIVNTFQRILSFIQISSIIFVIALGVSQLVQTRAANFHDMFTNVHLAQLSPTHIGVALFSALWSYDGWAHMSNVIEEIQDVERNLSLTIIIGVPFVIICYLMANIAFLSVLTHSQMATSQAVAIDFIEAALGMKISYVMMGLVALSAFGSLNGAMFACPRLTLSAAREGHMPQVFSLLHKKNKLPVPASLLITIISSLMLLPDSSNLKTLILLFSQAQWIIYSASVFGVIVLRVRQPEMVRPFKVFIGIPILVTLIGVFLVVMPFFRNFILSLTMVAFVIIGIPVYFVFVKFWNRLPVWLLKLYDTFNVKVQWYFNMGPCTREKYDYNQNEYMGEYTRI